MLLLELPSAGFHNRQDHFVQMGPDTLFVFAFRNLTNLIMILETKKCT
jgi:hypothetical protein